MARMRSPSYPSISLSEAIELVKKIHEKSRTNIIDREAAAKDMGYSGITGRSLTILAGLIQFGLLEKAGKGGVRVSRTTVDILHGLTDEIKKSALLKAGTSPSLYQEIMERFPEGIPSDNALKSYLIQRDFADVAIGPAVSSFLETYRTLGDANVFESSGETDSGVPESAPSTLYEGAMEQAGAAAHTYVGRTPPVSIEAIQRATDLNQINMDIRGNQVLISGLLDAKGLNLLEKKIAALKVLLAVYMEPNDTGDQNDDPDDI